MHPIERLRYVARASGASHELLVRETAGAMSAFADDPAGLITASRRVVARQPTSGPVWWLAARVLTAPDPMVEAWAAVEEMSNDGTSRELSYALPDEATITVIGWPEAVGEALLHRGDSTVLVVDALGEGAAFSHRLLMADVDAEDVPAIGLGAAVADSDLVLLEASAVGPTEFLGVAGSRAAAATARHAGVPVWLVAGVGRLLPQRMWETMAARLEHDAPWDADDEVVPLDLVDQIVGPEGPEPVAEALRRCDCPVAPELFKQL